MIASARKMKRTKREEMLLAETMNGRAINQLGEQHIQMAEQLNAMIVQVLAFQKEILAIKNALLSKGFLTELEVAQQRSAFEEMERYKSQALIIGEKK